jgi:hypothetical protein
VVQSSPNDKVCDAVMTLLAARLGEGSVCPSEVARTINPGTEWRSAMPTVHAAVDALVAERLVRLSWKGEPLALREGPYRINRFIKD